MIVPWTGRNFRVFCSILSGLPRSRASRRSSDALEYKEEWDQAFEEKGRELMEEVGGSERYLTLSVAEQLEFAKRLINEAQICLSE